LNCNRILHLPQGFKEVFHCPIGIFFFVPQGILDMFNGDDGRTAGFKGGQLVSNSSFVFGVQLIRLHGFNQNLHRSLEGRHTQSLTLGIEAVEQRTVLGDFVYD